MPFHIPTLFLVVGVLYLLMPAMAWVVLSGQRARSVALWCGGGEIVGIGLVLIGLRPNVPDWVTYPLANGLMFCGNLMRAQALRDELQMPWRHHNMALAGIGFLALYECLRQLLHDPLLRFEWGLLAQVCLFAHIAWLARRMAHRDDSTSARWISFIYALAASLLLSRAVRVGLGYSQPNAVAAEIDSALTAGAALMSSVIGSMGFIGVFMERARAKDLATAAAMARQEEHNRLHAQIAQLDRRHSLGEMAASIGHELNQPLTAILADAQLAQHGLAAQRFSQAQLNDLFEDIEKNTLRASQILDRIRSFIRTKKLMFEPVALPPLLQDVADLASTEARAQGVSFQFDLEDSHLRVMGDSIQLSQIVLNAYLNAIQAMANSPQRLIRVSTRREGAQAVLCIEDTGPGLAPEFAAQVGTAFFSTKEQGLGVGLSISRAIAEQHGGALSIDNGPAGGARVTLRLPRLA